jgi:hypothetical protein
VELTREDARESDLLASSAFVELTREDAGENELASSASWRRHFT